MGSSAHPISPAYGFRMRQTLQLQNSQDPDLCDSRLPAGGQNAKQARGIFALLIDQAHSKAKEPA